MPVRGVLLDKDGTLIDCDLTWAPVIRRLAEEMGPPGEAPAMVERAGLDPATGRFRAGSVWAAGSTRDLVALWWPGADEGEFQALAARIDAVCAEMGPHTAVPLLDLDALFATLSGRGLTVGIATNDSSRSLSSFLDVHGLAGRIPHLYGYDSVPRAKPAPDMVHAFAAATGIAPGDVAVVGDNTHDLEMARAAGALAVGVLSGNGGPDDLSPLADVVLGSVAELADWLDAASPPVREFRQCSTT